MRYRPTTADLTDRDHGVVKQVVRTLQRLKQKYGRDMLLISDEEGSLQVTFEVQAGSYDWQVEAAPQ